MEKHEDKNRKNLKRHEYIFVFFIGSFFQTYRMLQRQFE